MIRMTGYGIKIDGSSLGDGAWDYETAVSTHLDGISVHKVGMALLWALSTHGLAVTIKPHPKAECNAVGGTDETGAGSVTFSPKDWMTLSPLACNHAATAGADPRAILFHELVHALRGVAGKWRHGRVGGLRAEFTGDEEFIAIMLTNIYSSERGRPLRQSHQGFVPLPQTSGSTLRSAAKISLIEVVKRDHPEMCRRIKASSAAYNPIKAYDEL